MTMTPIAWIVLMSLAGGLLSVLVASGISYAARPHWVPVLISYAIGALLGASFLEVLPHAIEAAESPEKAAMNILAGILLFFVLEKLVLWRHCHDEGCAGHEPHSHQHGHGHGHGGHDHGRSGLLILVGDTFHNFVDGVLIAAAFLADPMLGVSTTLAVVIHEIPQELGDFVLLLNAGWSRRKAFVANALSSLTAVGGGLLGYFALAGAEDLLPYVLTIAAASFIYIAVADLLPMLHRQRNSFAVQSALIGLGVMAVPVLGHWVH